MKLRGIDLRRHDTAGMVRDCQKEILALLSQASNSAEFRDLIPSALEVARKYVRLIRAGRAHAERLVLEKRLSKSPNEYRNLGHQVVAAQRLGKEGRYVHAGQNIRYIVTCDSASIQGNLALPAELFESSIGYDADAYVRLLTASVENLIAPIGYDRNQVEKALNR
jgi:DNA polymerase-2